MPREERGHMPRIQISYDRPGDLDQIRQLLEAKGFAVDESLQTNDEKRFRALIENGHDGIILWDADGKVLYTSPSTTTILGYSPEELLNLNAAEFVHPESQEPYRESLNESLRRPGTAIHAEGYVRHKNGEWRFLEGTLTNLLDEPNVGAIVNNYRDITDRKLAQDAVRITDARTRLLIKASNIGLWDWDIPTNKVYFSPEWKRQIGYTEDEISDRYEEWESRLHLEDLEAVLSAKNDYLEGRRPDYDVEFRLRHNDGSWRWILSRADMIRDETGRPIRLLGCHVDITERKQGEMALRGSEGKLSLAMRAANMGSWGLNIDTLSFEADALAKVMHGFTAEQPIADVYQSLRNIHPDDVSETKRRFKQSFKTCAPFEAEYRVVLPNGNIRWITSQGDVDQSTRYLIGVVQDITERKNAEAALRTSEDQYRDLVDNMHDLVCTHDAEGRLLFANRASAHLLGYEPEELVGKNLSDILAPGLKNNLKEYLRTIQSKGEASGLMRVRTRSGETRLWEYHNTLRRDGPEALTVRGLARDITERKQTEDEIKTSRDRLRALSARLDSARDEEARRIAREIHDELGGALTSLKWDIEAIDKAVSATASGDELRSVRERIPVVAGLIDSTIDTVRRISSELRPPVLDHLGLAAAIESQAGQFEKRTGIKCKFVSNTNAGGLSDEGTAAIYRIFKEIMTNVVRHAGAKRIDIRLTKSKGWLVLRVKDNGRGITDEEKKGTHSLGLLGIQERALLVGGEVDISGVPGKGTTVVVWVPVGEA